MRFDSEQSKSLDDNRGCDEDASIVIKKEGH